MLQAFPRIIELTVNRSVFFGITSSSAGLGDEVHEAIATHCRHLRLLATDLLDMCAERVHGVLSLTRIQSLSAVFLTPHAMFDTLLCRISCSLARTQYLPRLIVLHGLRTAAHRH